VNWRTNARRAALMLAAALSIALSIPATQDVRTSQVGVTARISDLVLPGSELSVDPPQKDAPLVLRIVAVRPHGDAFRYDLEYWGLEQGTLDLRDWLRRADGTSTADLPPLPVEFTTALGEGQVEPSALAPRTLPRFGGYRTWMMVGGVLWAIGLIALLAAGRSRRLAAAAALPRPMTLAERLRPLVERALQGKLDRAERAQLELSLVAFWRKRLGLEERRPEQVLVDLREHPEAGPLLRGLEDWLHRPEPRGSIDVGALLAPYRDLPADALGERAPAAGA
jgi:hypothetical protein